MSVEFIYSKYDQGWQLEDCFWNMNGYDLINELDDEEITGLCEERNAEKGYEIDNDSIKNNGDIVIADGSYTYDFDDYLDTYGTVHMVW